MACEPTYDAEGNLLAVTQSGATVGSYVYDALNHRVSVTSNGTTSEYLYDYAGRKVSTWTPGTATATEGRIYWDGQQIAFRAANASTYFDHQDWVGTDRIRTDPTGKTAFRRYTLPWGDGGNTSGFGQSPAGQDTADFAGLDIDVESSTEHAQFRNYSPAQGRWLSPDPYGGSYHFSNPESFNRYVYALNNPLSFVDPSGLTDCNDDSSVCVYSGPPEDPCDGDPYFCYGGGYDGGYDGGGGGGGGGGGTGLGPPHVAPNKPVVIPNPCPYQGHALPPSAYAQAGQAANGDPVNFTLDVTMGFPGGDYLDPQPLASGNTYQNQAYGNYTFGVYMQAAGVTLSQALSGANGYAAIRKVFNPQQYANQTMDLNYPSLPAASVGNITNGFTAQARGTTCHN